MSLLAITAYPDERPSTGELRSLLEVLDVVGFASAQVWFLRCADHQQPWPRGRVIDSLRTWWPAALTSALGAERVAGALRGARLRAWLRSASPDIVLLDDGLGARLLEHAPGSWLTVVRLNAEPPADRLLEPAGTSEPVDLLLVDPLTNEPEPPARVRRTAVLRRPDALRMVPADARAAARAALEVPIDRPLLVGWGADGWLDGPDVFVRALWAARRRGLDLHGLWSGLGADPHELARLEREAERCGVSDQLHLRPEVTLESRLCGDAVLFCDRSPDRPGEDDVLESVVTGTPVLSFWPEHSVEDYVTVVAPLDVEAVADHLATSLSEGYEDRRTQRHQQAVGDLDLPTLLQRLLDDRSGTAR